MSLFVSDIQGFKICKLAKWWRHTLEFANSTRYAWSSKNINTVLAWNHVGGDWKSVSCHGNRISYSHRCVSFRTMGLPICYDLRYKLAKVAVFIYWSHQSSHLHILPIFQSKISPELMQILANGKQRFYSFMEFYLMNSKNQGGKIIIVPLQKRFIACALHPWAINRRAKHSLRDVQLYI